MKAPTEVGTNFVGFNSCFVLEELFNVRHRLNLLPLLKFNNEGSLCSLGAFTAEDEVYSFGGVGDIKLNGYTSVRWDIIISEQVCHVHH